MMLPEDLTLQSAIKKLRAGWETEQKMVFEEQQARGQDVSVYVPLRLGTSEGPIPDHLLGKRHLAQAAGVFDDKEQAMEEPSDGVPAGAAEPLDRLYPFADGAIDAFLQNGSKRTMVLLGDAGAGKSALARWYAERLWQQRQGVRAPEEKQPVYLPILIPLARQYRPDSKVVESFLREKPYRLTEDEIDSLKTLPLLIMLDGVDELKPEDRRKNLYYSNELW